MRTSSPWIAAALLVGAAAAPGTAGAQAVAEAQAQAERRQFAAARATLERHLAAAPDDEAARFLLARVLAWQGQPEAALPIYEALLARSPDNADTLLGYGQAQLWAGRRDAAIATLERAQRLAPDYVEVAAALAQARAADRADVDAAAANTGSESPAAPTSMGDRAARPETLPDLHVREFAEGAAPAASRSDVEPEEGPSHSADATAAHGAGTTTGGATQGHESGFPAVADGDFPPGDPAARRRTVALSARHDRLDRGYDDWRAVRLDVVATGRGRAGGYGALVSERRFGLDDHGLELGAVLPLQGGWTLQPQLGIVPGAEFLPRRFFDLRIERDFGDGWIGAASVRRSDYRDARVERLALGAERYFGAWRAGYTLNLTRVDGRSALGHDVRLARGYGDRSEVGAQLVVGREDTMLGTRIVASDVRAFSIGGRHAWSPRWALLWNAGTVRQGDFYTRDGVTLGVERRF